MAKIRGNQVELSELFSDGVRVTGILDFVAAGSPATSTPQIVFPNYTTTNLPTTELEGGVVYDITTKTLTFYNGVEWSEISPANNWVHANAGVDFPNPPAGLGVRAIAIGESAYVGSYPRDSIAIGTSAFVNNAISGRPNAISIGTSAYSSQNAVAVGNSAYAAGTDAIAIGDIAQAASTDAVSIGHGSQSNSSQQTLIGQFITAGSVDTTFAFSARLGYGTTGTNKNLLHLFDKGKLELYGEEAQFILPNYITGDIPATIIEGGIVYDSTTKEVKFYNGSWTAVGAGGGASTLGDLTDVTLGGSPLVEGGILAYQSGDWVDPSTLTVSLSVSGTTNYETLVTDDDDIPNKKYVDDNDRLTINAQSVAEYTLVIGDENALVTMSNAGANTLIIPINASVAFPIGTQILVEQEGAASTTISGGTGSPPPVTIHSAGNLFSTASQYTTISLIKKATDTWLIVGDLI